MLSWLLGVVVSHLTNVLQTAFKGIVMDPIVVDESRVSLSMIPSTISKQVNSHQIYWGKDLQRQARPSYHDALMKVLCPSSSLSSPPTSQNNYNDNDSCYDGRINSNMNSHQIKNDILISSLVTLISYI
jgi:hypothetical protein